jgi:hypothetical protein
VVGTLAAGLALVPMAVQRGAAGLEIVGPMAVIVLGGLVTTALLNLFILPAMYLRFAARPRPAAPAVDGAHSVIFADLRRGAYPAVDVEDQEEPIQGVIVEPGGLVPGSPGPYNRDPVEEA